MQKTGWLQWGIQSQIHESQTFYHFYHIAFIISRNWLYLISKFQMYSIVNCITYEGHVQRIEGIESSAPHCWKCDSRPLISEPTNDHQKSLYVYVCAWLKLPAHLWRWQCSTQVCCTTEFRLCCCKSWTTNYCTISRSCLFYNNVFFTTFNTLKTFTIHFIKMGFSIIRHW